MRQALIFISLGLMQLLYFDCNRNRDAIDTQSAPQLSALENKGVNLDLELQQNESLFKVWLRDTLKVLNAPPRHPTYYDKSEFYITNDSLSLSITQYFSAKITANSQKLKDDNPVVHILELLTEYQEYPRKPFQISFHTTQQFYPSAALAKDFIYDVEEIKVVERNTVCKYDYIRGRISEKEEIVYKNQKPFKSKRYDFSWAGDTLSKMLLSER